MGLRVVIPGVAAGTAYEVETAYVGNDGIQSGFRAEGTVVTGGQIADDTVTVGGRPAGDVLNDLDAALAAASAAVSDNVITKAEKTKGFVSDLKALIASQALLAARATALGITTEKTAFDGAMATLNGYLATLTTPVAWDNLTGSTSVVGATFTAHLTAALQARATLTVKIDERNANANITIGADGRISGIGTANILVDVTQGAFVPRHLWQFVSGAEGWTVNAGSLTHSGETLTFTAGNADPQFIRTGLSIVGAQNPVVRVRARPLTASPTFQGQLFYSTAGHSWSASFVKTLPNPGIAQNQWRVFEFDMTALSAGGTDWITNTITGLRIDLANTQQDWEIDWVAIGTAKIDAANLRGIKDNADQTSLNIADGYKDQSAWGTYTAIPPVDMAGRVGNLDVSGKFASLEHITDKPLSKLTGRDASAINYSGAVSVESLRPGEAGANITESRIADGFKDQGAMSLLNSIALTSPLITGKNLANLDSAANAKLSGIAPGATVGATWGVNLASQPADALLLNEHLRSTIAAEVLVENPNFGEGNKGWLLTAGVSIENDAPNAYIGTHYMRCAAGMSGINRNAMIFPARAAERFLLESTAMAVGSPNANISVRIRFLRADKSSTPGQGGFSFSAADGAYVTKRNVFVAPAETAYAWVDVIPAATLTVGEYRVGEVRCDRLTEQQHLAPNAVRLGANIVRADGSTSLTDAIAVTSLGIADGFKDQGAMSLLNSIALTSPLITGKNLANLDSAANTKLSGIAPGATVGADWTANLDNMPVWSTDGRVAAGLDASGDLNRNIAVSRANSSNLLRYATGGLFTGELAADVTGSHIALGFVDAGDLAYKNAVNLASSDVINKSLANLDSAANTKLSGIAPGATVGADWTANLGNMPVWSTDGRVAAGLDASGDLARNLTVARLNSSDVLRRTGGALFTGELAADVTGSHIALGFVDAGDLAYKNAVNLASSDVINKSLANLDSGANTKLSGIAAGATVGATWGVNLASQPADAALLNLYAGFGARRTWLFDSTVDGFTAAAGSVSAATPGVLTLTSSAADCYTVCPVISYAGRTIPKVRARVRLASGSGTWEGRLYYTTAGHGYSGSYRKDIAQPAGWAAGEWCVLEFDMTVLSAGGTDWIDSTITRLRFDLLATGTYTLEFDWVSLGDFGHDPVALRNISDNADQTSLNVADSVKDQGPWTVYTAISPSGMAGRVAYLDGAGNFASLDRITDKPLSKLTGRDASAINYAGGATLEALRPTGSYVVDPTHQNWTGAGLPGWWSAQGSPTVVRNTVNHIYGSQCLDISVGAAANQWITTSSVNNLRVPGAGAFHYVTIRWEIELVSGDFSRSGILYRPLLPDTSNYRDYRLSFQAEHGASPAAGRYVGTKTIASVAGAGSPSGLPAGSQLYYMMNWASLTGGADTAKNIRFHRVDVREATAQEISALLGLQSDGKLGAGTGVFGVDLKESVGVPATTANFKTSLGIADGFKDQGAMSLLNSIALTSPLITGKNLANLDSAANTKLSGIAAGATVGADWTANLDNMPVWSTDERVPTALQSDGKLGANTGLFGVDLKESVGVPATTANFKTSLGIADGFKDQGAMSLLNSIALTSPLITGKNLANLDSGQNAKLNTLGTSAAVVQQVVAPGGGDVAGVRFLNGIAGPALDPIQKILRMANDSNGQVVEVLRHIGGNIHILNSLFLGASMALDPSIPALVIQAGSARAVVGVAFGANSDLVMWFGPSSVAVGAMTQANATFCLTTAGGGRFRDSLLIGDLSNSIQTSDTGSGASVILGPFGTNGAQKSVTLSYSAEWHQTEASGGLSWSRPVSATLVVERSLDGGVTWTQVGSTLNVSGYVDRVAQPSPEDSYFTGGMGGSVTITDTNASMSDFRYRGRLTSRTLDTGVPVAPSTQRISVISVE